MVKQKLEKKLWKKKKHLLFISLVLFYLFVQSIFVNYDKVITQNIPSFFYFRTEYLVENGYYLQNNTFDYAPMSFKEDYAPLLPLFTYGIYKIFAPFGLTLIQIATWTPTIIGIGVLAFLFYWKPLSALIFSVLPASFRFFLPGYFSSEILGIMLMVGAFYFIWKNKPIFAAFMVALMSLAWQEFIIPLAIIVFIFFVKRNLKEIGLIFIFLFLAREVSLLIGTNYDPFNMINEVYQGFFLTYSDIKYQKAVFTRENLISTSLDVYIERFTIPLIILSLFGFLSLLMKIKSFDTNSLMLALWFLTSLTISVLYIRFLILLIPPFCIIAAEGFGNIERYSSFLYRLLKNLKFNKIFKS